MGKNKSSVSPEELVRQALLAIGLAYAPPKLSGKGGVFPSASAAAKDAIARLKEETRPLIVETGSGKTATVSLTPAGFEQIADAISADRLPGVVSGLAAGLSPSRRVAFLQEVVRESPQTVRGLGALLEEAVAAEKAEVEERAREAQRQRETEAASLAALERWKSLLLERKRQRITALQNELAAEGAEVEVLDVLPLPVAPPPAPKPSSIPSRSKPSILPFPDEGEDIAFRRNVARRLVSAWVDAWDANKPEAKEFLEAAIWNVSGFRPVGEVGQVMKFDGAYHEGGAGLFTGDPVRVVRPGWVLEEADEGEYVVLKAQVARV